MHVNTAIVLAQAVNINGRVSTLSMQVNRLCQVNLLGSLTTSAIMISYILIQMCEAVNEVTVTSEILTTPICYSPPKLRIILMAV